MQFFVIASAARQSMQLTQHDGLPRRDAPRNDGIGAMDCHAADAARNDEVAIAGETKHA